VKTRVEDFTNGPRGQTFKVEQTLPSVQSSEYQLRYLSDELRNEMTTLRFQETDKFWVDWAVVEIGINALNHGNKWQPQKVAAITCEIGKDAAPKDYPGMEVVRLTVEDEGGRTLSDLPDPKNYASQYQAKVAKAILDGAQDDSIVKLPSGRGWAVLIEKADKTMFEHTPKGLKVTAIFVKDSDIRKKT
jgi:hypothetical protein